MSIASEWKKSGSPSASRSRVIVLETHTDGEDVPRPIMVFYPGASLNDDPSNMFGPNAACVEAMLHEVGFSRVDRVGVYNGNRLVVHAFP